MQLKYHVSSDIDLTCLKSLITLCQNNSLKSLLNNNLIFLHVYL